MGDRHWRGLAAVASAAALAVTAVALVGSAGADDKGAAIGGNWRGHTQKGASIELFVDRRLRSRRTSGRLRIANSPCFGGHLRRLTYAGKLLGFYTFRLTICPEYLVRVRSEGSRLRFRMGDTTLGGLPVPSYYGMLTRG
jgi:hypothetical protein